VIRFAELYHQVKFTEALALLRQWRGVDHSLLHEAERFYRIQLQRRNEALAYLFQRGIRSSSTIELMRIGYAPGGCLRGWLTQLGHSLSALCQAGLITAKGYDAYVRRIVFPLEGNLYGRSLSAAAPPHRFLPGGKGGLYDWARVRQYPEVILVEGLFDCAVLWEAGFYNVTCSLGAHLNARQFRQLCDAPRTVYLAFDADSNGSGQQAAHNLSRNLRERGIDVRLVLLPEGHDPNSSFVEGGDARQFQSLLEAAQPLHFTLSMRRPLVEHRVRFALSNRRRASESVGSIVTWIASTYAACRTRASDFMLTICCTLSVGGRVFTIPVTSRKVILANPCCWITSDFSPPRIRALPAPRSTPASPPPTALSVTSSPMLPAR
jgi:DNA primase